MFLGQMIAIWVISGIITVFWLMVTVLIIFHIYLVYSKQTTYEYMIAQKKNAVAP